MTFGTLEDKDIVKRKVAKPPGYVTCIWCHGTTYLFERVDEQKSKMLFIKCTNCKAGFISFDNTHEA